MKNKDTEKSDKFVIVQDGNNYYYKRKETDTILWTNGDEFLLDDGPFFTFDKKTFYTIFRDYPHNLTKEQLEIFDRENPDYAEWYAKKIKNK